MFWITKRMIVNIILNKMFVKKNYKMSLKKKKTILTNAINEYLYGRNVLPII